MGNKSDTGIAVYGKGIVTFVFLAALNVAAWYIFFNPKGIMRLYTPMYGFSMVVVLLASVVILSDVFEYWPVRTKLTERLSAAQGAMLTVLSLALMALIIFVFFYRFIGKYGITYFSPAALIATGETGAEAYSSRENASTAIIYFFTAFIWTATLWRAGFQKWPWTQVKEDAGVLGLSRLFAVSFFSIIAYIIFFHPHVGYLFYPPQKMAAVAPWWEGIADTNSAYVHLGWMICCVAAVLLSEILWEGYPWKAFRGRGGEGSLFSGLAILSGIILLGLVIFVLMVKGMEAYWGKPFVGGQYTDAPYFRYLHAGEMAGFLMMGVLVVSTYLGNLFHGGPLLVRAAVRTVVAVALAAGFLWFYYTIGPRVLGQVPGLAQPEDTPLCWTFFMVSFMLMHRNFFLSYRFHRVRDIA